MNDEQQLRSKENLENLNKYKALQQQYKLLQSEHEDLSEACNKARAEQASCTKAVSHLDSQLSTLRQDLITREAEANDFKVRCECNRRKVQTYYYYYSVPFKSKVHIRF